MYIDPIEFDEYYKVHEKASREPPQPSPVTALTVSGDVSTLHELIYNRE